MANAKMKLVGAVIAGGQSSRFGGDKAVAMLNGTALIDHVINALSCQTDAILIVGRSWRDYDWVDDRPFRCGPLSGLCAALFWAQAHNYSHVLTAGCDILPIPSDLRARLEAFGSAVVEQQRLLGLWPSSLASQLEQHISSQADHSLRLWIKASGARGIAFDTRLHNLNSSADLNQFATHKV